MDLADFRALVFRAIPGLAGFHLTRYARVTKVYTEAGTHTREQPKYAVDIKVLDGNLKQDNRFKELRKISVSSPSEYEIAPPRVGTICLWKFPFWRGDTATIVGVVFDNKQVAPEEGNWIISGPEFAKIMAIQEVHLGSAEDYAVLANKLIPKLETICDKMTQLAQSVCANGSPLNSGLVQEITDLKSGLQEVKSQKVRVGNNAQA